MIRVIEGNILEQVRQAPSHYLGEPSLTALYHFLRGYSLAEGHHGVTPSNLLPSDFHQWVAYRLHDIEATSGYRAMILNRFPNEEQAFKKFFELLDDHRSRRPQAIAKIRVHPSEPDIWRFEPGTEEKKRVRVAKEVDLVVYTDDPGFFLMHKDSSAQHPSRVEFMPSLSWLSAPYKPDPKYVTVLDQGEFSRLVREAEAFEKRRGHQLDKSRGGSN